MVDVKQIVALILVVGSIGLLILDKVSFDQAMSMITYGLIVLGVETVYRLGKVSVHE
jgi:hypothetical protein